MCGMSAIDNEKKENCKFQEYILFRTLFSKKKKKSHFANEIYVLQ